MVPVAEALRVILERTPSLGSEEAGLGRVAGRVLAETIRADRDQPPFDRALVDGFAVRAADLNAGGSLSIRGTIPAGERAGFRVGPGEAAAIMTGAPMPEGTDAAIMVEHTTSDEKTVSWPIPGLPSPPRVAPGIGVARRGRDVRAGTPLLASGTRVTPAGIGLLATVGRTRIRVGRRPTVAVLSTGNELAHPRKQTLHDAEIRDANGPMLIARTRSLGLSARRLPIASDHPDALARRIREGLEADVLLLSGGVSMGRFDLVEDILEQLGATLHITSVAIRPGKPFVFATIGDPVRHWIFGLPGNPVSALTTFEVLARPSLERAEGLSDATRPQVPVRLEAPVANPGPRQAFLPARVRGSDAGVLTAFPIPIRGSGDISAIALANALLILPAQDSAEAGAEVFATPLTGFPDPGVAAWHDPRNGAPTYRPTC